MSGVCCSCFVLLLLSVNLHTHEGDNLSKALVYYCFPVFRRIGEYIFLDLFYVLLFVCCCLYYLCILVFCQNAGSQLCFRLLFLILVDDVFETPTKQLSLLTDALCLQARLGTGKTGCRLTSALLLTRPSPG